MHPCCCCVAGGSRCCTGRRRTQMRPLSSWVLIVASYSTVHRCRNRARFTGSSSSNCMVKIEAVSVVVEVYGAVDAAAVECESREKGFLDVFDLWVLIIREFDFETNLERT
ncbi:uncharacterized protein DS421_12g362930 [Arachis hypogaea]|nr:uncharacterized protein DS421_12g362930 [Arachis hypogaea]